MNILKDSTDLIESTIISLLASLSILWHQACTRSEILLVLHNSEVSFVHLARHVLKVFEDANLVLFILPIKECVIRVLIVLDALLRSYVDIKWRRVTPLENLIAMKFFEEFIVKLQLLLN